MHALTTQPVRAVVYGGFGLSPHNHGQRLLKAAILYADTVQLAALTHKAALGGPHEDPIVLFSRDPDLTASVRVEWHAWARLAGETLQDADVPERVATAAELLHRDLKLALDAEALLISDPRDATRAAWRSLRFEATQGDKAQADGRHLRDLLDSGKIPVAAKMSSRAGTVGESAWLGAIATALIGQLDAFPDADMDVILDVRERLKGPRTHFRGAIAELAVALSSVNPSERDVAGVVRDQRLRVVDPALQAIQEELNALGARRTLLRLASDRVTLTTGATQLAMAAGAPTFGLGRVLSAAALGAFGAAAAKEAELRATVMQDLRARPYWLLHEADQALRDA